MSGDTVGTHECNGIPRGSGGSMDFSMKDIAQRRCHPDLLTPRLNHFRLALGPHSSTVMEVQLMANNYVWVCPVMGCDYVATEDAELRGHMAGSMQQDPTHEWGNVPISHYDLSDAKVATESFGLGAWTP